VQESPLVQTEGTQSSGIIESELRKKVEARTPLGRIGLPKDIAKAAVFFASDDSAWITSETLVITGGFR
jgi:3-oxoacyl-[acyl-carrier protein] reductase